MNNKIERFKEICKDKEILDHVENENLISDYWITEKRYRVCEKGWFPDDDDEPLEFTILEMFLTKNFKTFSLIDYLKLKKIIEFNKDEEFEDYYEAGIKNYYQIDINKLMDFLEENGYLK